MDFPGNCLYNHSQKKMWLDIPKNASKSISYHLLNMGWKNGNYIDDEIYDYQTFIIVRDVLDRWKGSTIEICYHHVQYNLFDFTDFGKWFKENNWKEFDKNIDLHHQKLSFFNEGLSNIKYIAMDRNFEYNVKNNMNIQDDIIQRNSTIENEHKLKIKPYVDELLSDETFRNKIYDFYEDDQRIFNLTKE